MTNDSENVVAVVEEKIEKETLLSHGFLNWDRRDFQKFLQALEIYPREDY